MGISLHTTDINPHGGNPQPVTMNLQTWVRLLCLARTAGWQPIADLPVLVKSMRQLVRGSGKHLGAFDAGCCFSLEQARDFGNALQNALQDIPREDSRGNQTWFHFTTG